MEITGAGEKVHGVSGVDVPLTVIENIMCNTPDNSIYTIERHLVTTDGKTVIRCTGDRNGFKKDNRNAVDQQFDSRILADMRTHRYGRRIRSENGKEMLWLFSLIPSAQWIYVEKIDLSKLLLVNRISMQ